MALVYSCCFWFSLRLGGILIGVFSIFQAIAFLTGCCLAYTHSQVVEDEITGWSSQFSLPYSKELLDTVLQDPKKYICIAIVCTCIYLIVSVIFIYGAYICNNVLLMFYIILELVRLLLIAALVATGLLALKQNTMDIGLLIAASVVGGFFLLGMFYLWVCAANLPILINEMARDEHAAMIAKLQALVATNQKPKLGFDNVRYTFPEDPPFARNVFVVSNKNKTTVNRSRIPVHY